MKNILITGATGSIGSKLYEELHRYKGKIVSNHPERIVIGASRKLDESCRIFKCDLLKKEDIKELFRFCHFDYIFHLAANPIVDISKTGIGEIYDSNVKTTLNLLEGIPVGKCPHFIFSSSTTVYSQDALNDDLNPANEKMAPIPNSIYGASKIASEALIGAFGNMGRIKPLILRYCAVVGSKFTHGALPDLCRKYKNDKIVRILGNKPGSQKPFIHVNDAIFATLNLAFLGKTGIYNIVNEDTISVQEIVDIISSKLGKKEEIWMGDWVGDNLKVNVSNKKYLDGFNRFARIQYSSREAIEKVIGEILNDNNKGAR